MERAVGNPSLDAGERGTNRSTWWSDLCRLDKDSGWFNQLVGKKLGCGNRTKFWLDVWRGGSIVSIKISPFI
jgi:hypothetical protein